MKVAIDPYMFRTTPLPDLPGVVADLGFEYIELSPREDLTPFFLHPRVDDAAGEALQEGAGRGRGEGRRATCRSTAGPARTRTSGRPRSATGSGPSRSPSTSTAT